MVASNVLSSMHPMSAPKSHAYWDPGTVPPVDAQASAVLSTRPMQ